MVELVPSLLRQELEALAANDQRIDGRGRWESREIKLETNCLYNAEGSAKVTWGDTLSMLVLSSRLELHGLTDPHKVP